MLTTTADATTKLPKYVRIVENRHGNDRFVFQRRRGAPKRNITTRPGTPDFEREYHVLMAGLDPATFVTLDQAALRTDLHMDQYDDSVGALCAAYLDSDDFQHQHNDSQIKGRRLINNCLQIQVMFQGKLRKFASWPCDLVTPTTMKDVRAALTPTRATKDPKARHWRDQHMQFFRSIWNWALQEWTCHESDTVVHLLRTANPCAKLKPLAPGETAGWNTMTASEVARFEKHFPVGTIPHLAMALLRYTVVRRSDAAVLGTPMLHRRDGKWFLVFTEEKGKDKSPKERELVVKDELLAVIQATPGAMERPTFIVGKRGGALQRGSFGELFKEWLVEAGVPHCSCHSVRKFVATYLADNEATPHVIRAIGGWTNLRQVMRYTKMAENKRLSSAAVEML